MTTDDWAKLASVINPVVQPLLTIAVGAWLNYKITSTKDVAILELDIDEGDDCITKDNEDYGNGRGSVPRCHVRFRLRIDGTPNGAKKCDVKLLRVYRVEQAGELVPIGYPNKYPLHWNTEWKKGEHAEKDLPHGAEQYVDLLVVESYDGIATIKLKDIWYTKLSLEMGKTYLFEVQAISGNAKSVGKMVEVVFGDNYSDVQIKRSRSRHS